MRLQRLIEDLLTLSTVESGSFGLRYRPVNVKSIVQDVVDALAIVAAEKDVSLRLNTSNDLGTCPGDATQLARALNNVIGNAVKFTPAGGAIDVVVERSDFDILIHVTDTGIGIPHEEQSKTVPTVLSVLGIGRAGASRGGTGSHHCQSGHRASRWRNRSAIRSRPWNSSEDHLTRPFACRLLPRIPLI